jgi:hypothetical protein
MTGHVRVGIAQWTPDRDPGVNLRTAEAALGELACAPFTRRTWTELAYLVSSLLLAVGALIPEVVSGMLHQQHLQQTGAPAVRLGPPAGPRRTRLPRIVILTAMTM